VALVNDRAVAYITILLGANDLCTRTVAGMTSLEAFRTEFEEAMAASPPDHRAHGLYV
jgi:hypothetical protein